MPIKEYGSHILMVLEFDRWNALFPL